MPTPISASRALALGLFYWLTLAALATQPRLSGNVFSRYMTVESIVERGTLAIGDSPMLAMSGTPDLARFGGRTYSDKPPVLPALGALVYAPLARSGVRFMSSPRDFGRVDRLMVVALVGLGSTLTVVSLRFALQWTGLPRWVSDLLALSMGFASPLWSYAGTFNNHSVAAGLIMAAITLVIPTDANRRFRPFLAGFLSSLAATIDLPAGGLVCAGLLVTLALGRRKIPIAFLIGCLPPLLLHIALQSMVTGSPLPVEMYPQALEYPGSYWTTPAGRWVERGPRWRFALELLVGPQGWLTVTPALMLGLVAMVRWGWSSREDALRPIARLSSVCLLVLILYYVWGVRRTDFAGQSYGVRHLLPMVAPVWLFAAVALDRWRNPILGASFVLLLGVGGVYSWSGRVDPWSRVESRKDPSVMVLQRFVVYPWSSYAR
jgi:hypothetical protein